MQIGLISVLGRTCQIEPWSSLEQYVNKNENINKKLVFIYFIFIFLLKKLVFLKSMYDIFYEIKCMNFKSVALH
jgi:hypothetical protein